MKPNNAKAHALALINGYQSTCLIIAATQTGLLTALVPGCMSVDDLAVKLGVNPQVLFRFMRALEAIGVLQFESNGVVLSEAGSLMAEKNSSISSIPILVAEEYLPAWCNLCSTLQNGKPAFEQLFGVSVWKHRQDHPHLNDAFVQMITEPATNEVAAILDAYDFSKFRQIVDVGGGSGWLLSGILKKYPTASGILFDQPHVVHGFIENLAAGIKERCTAVGGSFFDFVPREGDLYLMQSILHDWGDDECVLILTTVRKSMTDEDKLLILEKILPTEGAIPVHMAMLDMHMMTALGGRERNLAEYNCLLEKAGFRLVRTIPTVGFAADIIEVEIAKLPAIMTTVA